ncbi:unnamed protein product [Boreogadus saida]
MTPIATPTAPCDAPGLPRLPLHLPGPGESAKGVRAGGSNGLQSNLQYLPFHFICGLDVGPWSEDTRGASLRSSPGRRPQIWAEGPLMWACAGGSGPCRERGVLLLRLLPYSCGSQAALWVGPLRVLTLEPIFTSDDTGASAPPPTSWGSNTRP